MTDPVPTNLQRATLRLNFPPSYVVVGVYRLCTDESLYKPAWDKCEHGVQRGLVVGFVWVRLSVHFACRWTDAPPKTCLTYRIQRHFIRALLNNPSSLFSLSYITRLSQTASDLSEETFFGFRLPFNVSTCSFPFIHLTFPNIILVRHGHSAPWNPSYVYHHLLSLSQHRYCPSARMGPDSRLSWQGSRLLATVRRGMGCAAYCQ